jgi:hypothetical protein
MPKKKQDAPAPTDAADNVLVSTAKSIGTVAGKIASAVGAAAPTPSTPARPKVGKLKKKNKTRLPRRQKKAQQKAAKRQ